MARLTFTQQVSRDPRFRVGGLQSGRLAIKVHGPKGISTRAVDVLKNLSAMLTLKDVEINFYTPLGHKLSEYAVFGKTSEEIDAMAAKIDAIPQTAGLHLPGLKFVGSKVLTFTALPGKQFEVDIYAVEADPNTRDPENIHIENICTVAAFRQPSSLIDKVIDRLISTSDVAGMTGYIERDTRLPLRDLLSHELDKKGKIRLQIIFSGPDLFDNRQKNCILLGILFVDTNSGEKTTENVQFAYSLEHHQFLKIEGSWAAVYFKKEE